MFSGDYVIKTTDTCGTIMIIVTSLLKTQNIQYYICFEFWLFNHLNVDNVIIRYVVVIIFILFSSDYVIEIKTHNYLLHVSLYKGYWTLRTTLLKIGSLAERIFGKPFYEEAWKLKWITSKSSFCQFSLQMLVSIAMAMTLYYVPVLISASKASWFTINTHTHTHTHAHTHIYIVLLTISPLL